MNNKVSIVLIVLCIMFVSLVSRAELITTYSLSSTTIDKLNPWIDKETIIFIELDNTLVIPASKMFLPNSNSSTFIDDLISLGKRYPIYNEIVAKWYSQRKVKLVEPTWVEFIKLARMKGAKIYGICSMPLYLTNIESARSSEIRKLGVLFDHKVNNSEEFIIKQEYYWFSRFAQGIIYTGPYSKNETILEFFKITHHVPQKLISFINDKKDAEFIDRELRIFDMDFKTILYLADRKLQDMSDPEIVEFQQQALLEYGKWYEDDEASKLINSH